MVLSRRHLIATATACAALPHMARALTPDVITWKQLIPDGVPYSEIIAEGEMDEASDY